MANSRFNKLYRVKVKYWDRYAVNDENSESVPYAPSNMVEVTKLVNVVAPSHNEKTVLFMVQENYESFVYEPEQYPVVVTMIGVEDIDIEMQIHG